MSVCVSDAAAEEQKRESEEANDAATAAVRPRSINLS